MSGDNGNLIAQRLERLKSELSDENVPLLDKEYLVPEFDSPEVLGKLLLEELNFARYVPLHEGRRPPYGCLIVPSIDATRSRFDRMVDAGADQDLFELRALADG